MPNQPEVTDAWHRAKVLEKINNNPRHIAYRIARAGLIPVAEEYADRICGPRPYRKRGGAHKADIELQGWADKWTTAFLRRMHHLAVAAGLERCGRCQLKDCKGGNNGKRPRRE